ncbi:MAG: hypothetical protein IT435_09530 [Phycisphaerales bacterium]|nr:hypothetical protein [Phycisphaerales bacterium]
MDPRRHGAERDSHRVEVLGELLQVYGDARVSVHDLGLENEPLGYGEQCKLLANVAALLLVHRLDICADPSIKPATGRTDFSGPGTKHISQPQDNAVAVERQLQSVAFLARFSWIVVQKIFIFHGSCTATRSRSASCARTAVQLLAH